MSPQSKLNRQDPLVFLLTLALCAIGLVAVFSTTFSPDKLVSNELRNQVLFVALGWLAYVLITAFDMRWLKEGKLHIALYVVTALFLVLLYVLPTDGVRRWLDLGILSFQPSELAKLTVIITTAYLWGSGQSWRSQRINRVLNLIAVGALCVLIWQQPSLGNALILGLIWLAQLSSLLPRPLTAITYALWLGAGVALTLGLTQHIPVLIAGIAALAAIAASVLTRHHLKPLVAVVLCALAALGSFALLTSWEQLLTPYQRERITAYVQPESDPLGSQWQVNQARIALAAGQFFGKGLLQGTQVNYDLLPYAYTDFIFVAIGEQLGLIGTMTVLILLYLLVLRIWLIARHQPDTFGALCCYGVAVMITVNTFINVGMNTGLLPVTGVPLPFISYGGTAVIINLCGVGLVQCLHASLSHTTTVRHIISAA